MARAMKIIIYLITIQMLSLFTYKVMGDTNNHYWVCIYWFIFSLLQGIIFYKVRGFAFVKIHRTTILLYSIYWIIMSLFYFICLFNITLYDRFAMSANKLTVGAITIAIIFIYLSYKAWKYDKGNA